MRITEPRSLTLPPWALAAVALLLSIGTPALAANWAFSPSAAIAGIYSDNIGLDPTGFENDDFITELKPRFSLRRDDGRMLVDIDYRLQYLDYSETDNRDEIFNQLDALFSRWFLQQRLTLDVDGGIRQQIIDPERAFLPSNIPVTSNRTDATDFNVSPAWQQGLGPAELTARYSYGLVSYDQESLEDLERQQTEIQVGSAEPTGFSWSLQYKFDRQEFETAPEVEFEQLESQLGYWLQGRVRVFGAVGLESDFFADRTQASLDEDYWSVGFQLPYGGANELEVRYGERLFGSSLNVRWTHVLGAVTAYLSYSEAPTTDPETLLASRILRQLTPFFGAGLDRPGNTDAFVRERLDAGFTIERARASFFLDVFAERRTDRVGLAGVIALSEDEKARGSRFRWRWQMGSRTSLLLSLHWDRREFTEGRDFDLSRVSTELRYDLGSRTDVRLELTRDRRSADGAQDYRENRVGLFLDRRFGRAAGT